MPAIKSTTADRVADYTRIVYHFEEAARHLGIAVSLSKHHGASISYGESIVESIKLWALEAKAQLDTSLARGRRMVDKS
jgi:aspartate carbamoyltransferase catalytic subunit